MTATDFAILALIASNIAAILYLMKAFSEIRELKLMSISTGILVGRVLVSMEVEGVELQHLKAGDTIIAGVNDVKH